MTRTTNPLRIHLVSEHASPLAAIGGVDAGGQNVHVAELTRALARRGHDVTVFTRRDSPGLPDQVHPEPGVTVEHVPAGPPADLPKDALLPFMGEFADHLARRWWEQPPDLVHAHFWMSGLAAQRAAAGTGIPVLQTFHALGSVKRRHQKAADSSPATRVRLETELAMGAALVLATCADEVGELADLGVSPERTAVVPCGVDVQRFTARGPRRERPARIARHRLLSLSRMVERKGVDISIRALRHVPDTELLIAGGEGRDDPELTRLIRVAESAGVRERVRFLGQVPHDEVPALLRTADVVVSVPWYEPFGMVPLEAMACGVPVVASAVGGHLDTVLPGRTGALVPPRNPDALAATLRKLLAAPARLAAMGAAGAARTRTRYGWARIAEQTDERYQWVLSRAGDRATAVPGGTR